MPRTGTVGRAAAHYREVATLEVDTDDLTVDDVAQVITAEFGLHERTKLGDPTTVTVSRSVAVAVRVASAAPYDDG